MSQGGEKTEKATPHKRSEARKEGNVLKSQEVTMSLSLLVLFAALQVFAPMIVEWSVRMYQGFFTSEYMYADRITQTVLFDIAVRAMTFFIIMVGPLLAIAMVVGIVANMLQVGFLFTTKAIRPKFSKLNPLSGIKRMFSSHGLVELLKSSIKIIVLSVIVYNGIRDNIIFLPIMMPSTLATSAVKMFEIAMDIAFNALFAFAMLAAADYGYQWWKFEKDMRMSKQDIKDEYKKMEGDPKIKGKIKQKQRQMSMMRMMQSVPQADVVITNPTHFAVALRYKDGEDDAPVVLAKGADYVALRIKQVATEHGIEIVENKPMAQALYKQCEIGDAIPAEMYRAVAEILAAIYRVKNRMAGDAR